MMSQSRRLKKSDDSSANDDESFDNSISLSAFSFTYFVSERFALLEPV